MALYRARSDSSSGAVGQQDTSESTPGLEDVWADIDMLESSTVGG